jgi:precorrin-6Y C5,15-methyltransferase (decarboxylating)
MAITPIDVIGMAADSPASLRPEQAERVVSADFLAGGARHLAHFPAARGERFVIGNNLPALLTELTRRAETQRCVVLASGDPLFYGIGTYLAERAPNLPLRFEPALSSMQLAFARAGISWEQAALASVHGRDVRATLLPLLGRPLIGLFTQDASSPAEVARFFHDHGAGDYEARVAENLGTDRERLHRWLPLESLLHQDTFAPLHYLLLRRTTPPDKIAQRQARRALVPGAPDDEFERPADAPEVMTRQEIRAVTLAKLGIPTQPGDTAWDIGSGLGTLAIELAVLHPHIEVVAIERDRERMALLRKNRERFDALNVRVIDGVAPDALRDEIESPRAVFLGGSGDRLADILDLVRARLHVGGRLVANFVTLEHLTLTHQRLQEWGWPCDVTELQVARSDVLAGLTGLKPFRGVFLVSARKTEDAHV